MRRKLVVGVVCLMALMILPGAVFAADVIDALFVTADSVADATPQEGGYRSSAAAAKFSRVCASKYYGYGEGAVTCDVKVWTGYKWEDADQESFSVQLPDEPAIAPAQEAAKKGIPVWLWICLGVAAVTGVVLLI